MTIECPYCKAEQPAPDDCDDPSVNYQHECGECGKSFIFTVDYTKDFYPEKADCLNGGEHDYKQIKGCPSEYFIGRKRCSMCDDEIRDAV
jgi:hypothetical protein